MPSSSADIKKETNAEKPSSLKTDLNESKPDIGANIILIGAPGSGKFVAFFSI